LINDVEEHFKADYLNAEFSLITKKIRHVQTSPDLEYWIDVLSAGESYQISLPKLIYHCYVHIAVIHLKYDDEKSPDFSAYYK
jgi:hypothetical protein